MSVSLCIQEHILHTSRPPRRPPPGRLGRRRSSRRSRPPLSSFPSPRRRQTDSSGRSPYGSGGGGDLATRAALHGRGLVFWRPARRFSALAAGARRRLGGGVGCGGGRPGGAGRARSAGRLRSVAAPACSPLPRIWTGGLAQGARRAGHGSFGLSCGMRCRPMLVLLPDG